MTNGKGQAAMLLESAPAVLSILGLLPPGSRWNPSDSKMSVEEEAGSVAWYPPVSLSPGQVGLFPGQIPVHGWVCSSADGHQQGLGH